MNWMIALIVSVAWSCPRTNAQSTAPAGNAAPATVPSEAKQLADASAPTAAASSATALATARRDEYLQKRGLHIGTGNPGNAYIGWASDPVMAKTNDPSWPKSRVFAYESALRKAQADFIRFVQQRDEVESSREMLKDDSQINSLFAQDRQDDKSRWKVLEEKLLALGEAELDAKLREKGIDPDTVKGRPKSEKVDKLRRTLKDKTTFRAFGSLAGLRTLQTCVGFNEKGTYVVGVLVVYTPKFAALAEALRSGHATHIGMREPQPPITSQIPREQGALLDDFGVRVLIDENGDECLVSFGQWSVSSKDADDSVAELTSDAAEETARGIADQAIDEFANASAGWSNEQVRSEEFAKYLREFPQGPSEEVKGVEFIDRALTTMHVRANLTISGRTDVMTWRAVDPQYGREVVGVVRMWSPYSQQSAKDVRARPAAGSGEPEAKTKAGSRQGNDYDKIKDW
jgi:hypothetical protein